MTMFPRTIREASGLWDQPMTMESLRVFRAFYKRPWHDKRMRRQCTLDDICLLAAENNVDTEPLINMALAAGEFSWSSSPEEEQEERT